MWEMENYNFGHLCKFDSWGFLPEAKPTARSMASLVRAVNKDVFISQRVSNGHLLTTSRERVTQRESVGRSFHLVTTSILKYGR